MKKLLTNVIAIIMLVAVLVGCTACEDIKTMKVTIDVYQGQDIATPKSYEIKFDLYRHLAQKTVDHVKDLVKSGYYENTIFYKYGTENTEQLMLGDYIYDANGTELKFAENTKQKTYVQGEFEKAGVKGSDLVNEKYSIGLWRIFDSNTTNYGGSVAKLSGVDSVYNSGSASLFMPTATISGYNGYFANFGKITDEDCQKDFDKIITALTDSNYYSSYTVFWTGTDKDNLTKNIMLTQRYEDGVENGSIKDVFDPNDEKELKSTKADYYMYKSYTINVLQENRRVQIKKIEIV